MLSYITRQQYPCELTPVARGIDAVSCRGVSFKLTSWQNMDFCIIHGSYSQRARRQAWVTWVAWVQPGCVDCVAVGPPCVRFHPVRLAALYLSLLCPGWAWVAYHLHLCARAMHRRTEGTSHLVSAHNVRRCTWPQIVAVRRAHPVCVWRLSLVHSLVVALHRSTGASASEGGASGVGGGGARSSLIQH